MKEYYTERERLELLISSLEGGKKKNFADKTGITQPTLTRLFAGVLKIPHYSDKIIQAYPRISRDWLLTGVGYCGDISVDITEEHYEGILQEKERTISALTRELELQQEVIEKLLKSK